MSTPRPAIPILKGTAFASTFMKVCLALIGLGLIGSVAGALTDWSRFIHNWLLNFMLFGGVAVTGIFFAALQHLTRSGWSATLRRIPENFGAFVPLMILLVLPILLSMSTLYHWMHPDPADHILMGKTGYLNTGFFLARLGGYLLVWLVMFKFFVLDSYRTDVTGDLRVFSRNRTIAAPTMIFYAITMTFFAIDFLMSLDPHWYSTIYGVYYFSGSLVATLALVALIAALLMRHAGFERIIRPDNLHDLAKLLFAFNVFWAYIAFSQYFLYWYANIPEETIWYLNRWNGGWEVMSIGIIFFHFIIPFFLLLTRQSKRQPARVMLGAGWLFLAHYFDMFYLTMPSYSREFVPLGWMEPAVLVLFLGLFGMVVLRQLTAKSPVVVHDPHFDEALDVHN